MIDFIRRLLGRGRTSDPRWIETSELRQQLASGVKLAIVDVRQPEEFNAPPGHLPGAVNVPLAEVSHRASDLASRKLPIVVVCKTDRRSARAATALLSAGLRDVTVLRGGTDGWHRQDLPLE